MSEQPTRLFKVSVRYLSITGEAPRLSAHVLEYGVVNVTDKSYMIKYVAEDAEKRPTAHPKDAIGVIRGDQGSPTFQTLYMWVFGNTGQAVDQLKAQLLQNLKYYRDVAQAGIDLLEQEL